MSKNYSLLLLLLVSISTAFSQVKIEADPTWKVNFNLINKKPNPKDISDGYYEVLIEKQQHIELQARYTHIIREIISASGVQNGSEISVNYEPAFQKLIFHKIIVRRNGKEINKLTASTVKISPIEEDRLRFLYNGTNNASVILDDIRKGDLIDYSYTIVGNNPIFEGKFFDNIYFYTSYPVSQIYFVNIVSNKRKLYTKEYNHPIKPKTSERNGLTIYEWEMVMPKNFKFEEYEPQWYEGYPYIEFSEYNSWKQVVDWALPMYQIQKKPLVSLNSKIAELKKEANNDQERFAELATRFVQDEIRYMGIEVGTNSHKPHSSEKVFQQRYGDCKDKTLLLCNLLAGVGIEAYPALVNTYKRQKLNEKQPSPIAFNHVIVYANILGNWSWIDPTMSYQRGRIVNNYIPYYGKALIIKPNQETLTEIPENYGGTTKIIEKYTIPKVGEPAKLEVSTRYSVSFANNIRSTFAEQSLTNLETSYTDYYAGLFPKPAFVKLDTLYSTDEEKDNVFTVTEKYTIENIWEKKDSTKNINSITIWGQILKEHLLSLNDKSRISPIAISQPYELDYDIEMQFPEDWTITQSNLSIKRNSYEFKTYSEYQPNTRTWKLHFDYKNLKDYISASDYDQYNSDVKKINDELGKTLTWNPSISSADKPLFSSNNWLMIFITLISISVFGFLAYRFYKYSLPVTYVNTPSKFKLWLMFYGVILIFSLFYVLYEIFGKDTYLNLDVWNAFGENNYFYKFCLVFELVCMVIQLCWLILLITLFFNRRNTFPKFAIYYHLFIVSYVFIDMILSSILANGQTSDAYVKAATDFIRTLISATIWIVYLSKAQQVKDIFILPYGMTIKAFQEHIYNSKLAYYNTEEENLES